MIVYGKHRKKYVLSQNPVSQDYDGAIYSVPGNTDIMVKIYQPEYRTPEVEKQVIDTANGKCSMLDESPVDVVYANGRFAGYIFEQSAPELPSEEVIPPPPVRTGMGDAAAMLISVAVSLGLSALVYFVIFDALRNMVGDAYGYWNFNGVPMIVGGWVGMLLAFFQFRDRGGQTVVIAVVGYLLGAVLVFCAICLVVFLLSLAWSLVQALLPIVVTIAVVAWLLKMFLGR